MLANLGITPPIPADYDPLAVYSYSMMPREDFSS